MKKILFLSGTRADFGKMKTLMHSVEKAADFEMHVFVTGMHTLEKYGYTVDHFQKEGFKNIHVYYNQILNEPMDLILANTVQGLSRYVHENPPDMIVIHGDRVESLAGAMVGVLRNILVCHIEGGELSGTVDELIRHATSKLAHVHLVAHEEAKKRLIQMGENPLSVFVIGSPDIDVMASKNLPALSEVKKRYDITFKNYGIALYHPVTTEPEKISENAKLFVDALLKSRRDYVVVYPNNDAGTNDILAAYNRLKKPRFRLIPSLRFEHFLTLLKNADLIVGNSSAGVREAPFYGVPTVDVGNRQHRRFLHGSIVHSGTKTKEILAAIEKATSMRNPDKSEHFGSGDSYKKFMAVLHSAATWKIAKQKTFRDTL